MSRLALPMTALLALAALSAIPAASAEAPFGYTCGFDLRLFSAHYQCTVDGFGASGNLGWCPPGATCVWAPLLSCWADPSGMYCW